MNKEWFIHSKHIVSGPYSTEQVQDDLSRAHWQPEDLIWWKGQREWMTMSKWKAQVHTLTQSEVDKAQSPIWYLDIASEAIGPLTQNEMIATLRGAKHYNKIRLWTVNMSKWTNLFELPEVMEELGLSRREHERAPLLGTVAITRGDDNVFNLAKAATISAAGMGVNEAGFLSKGENIHLLIRSRELPYPVSLKGDVAYITNQGYAGIRFEPLSPETHSIIFDYVKRFNATVEVAKIAA